MPSITSFTGQYAFLSNFFPSEMVLFGKPYDTVEHFFQACKMTTNDDHEAVRCANTPAYAKRLGRAYKRREDWDDVKDSVMLFALREKFKSPALALQLVATGHYTLVEGNTWGDTYWGVCKAVGQNKLGQLLMQVRSEIKC